MGSNHPTSLAARLRSVSSPEEAGVVLTEAGQSRNEVVAALAAELRNAVRAREVLLASVAHDLRNPLNTFAMSAGLLRDDIEGPDFDRTRALNLLARMDRASMRMQALIEELLEASRVEAGAIELTCRAEAAGAIVRAVIAKGHHLAADKGATLEEGEILDEIALHVDRTRATEALLKLIAVALKSAGEGGTIRLGVEKLDQQPGFTVCAVPPRGPPTTALDEGRGGLALLIARGLFAAMGGRIAIETTAGGARTVVTFESGAKAAGQAPTRS
jgi:signal transduction histidine kinase